MAKLIEQSSQRYTSLASHVVIGRSPAASMRLSSPLISGEHAAIWWDGASWYVKDLASRNGTFVSGRRLDAGEVSRLAGGVVLGFGQADGWEVGDIVPPVARAMGPDGLVLVESDGMLCIPDSDDPRVIAYRNGLGDWVMDHDGVTKPALQDTVVVDAVAYTLDLPRTHVSTVDASQGTAVSTLALRIAVSLDEEHVQVEARLDSSWERLKPRAHHYLLLTLARLYQEDGESGPEQRGWVHVDDLCKMLGVRMGLLNMQVLRIRRELDALGVADSVAVIERRPLSSTLRLGPVDVEVATLA